MDVADRIKKSKDWTPLVKPQPEDTKHAQIGQWAAKVEPSISPGPGYGGTASPQSSSLYTTSPSAVPANTGSASGNSSVSFPSQDVLGASLYRDDSGQASTPLIDLSNDQPSLPFRDSWSTNADMRRKGRSDITGGDGMNIGVSPQSARRAPSPAPPTTLTLQQLKTEPAAAAASPIAPKLASPSHIHRLTEPVSTRKRSRKEDIILLKASVVNGFKCPPWDRTPAPTEFVQPNGQELFQ